MNSALTRQRHILCLPYFTSCPCIILTQTRSHFTVCFIPLVLAPRSLAVLWWFSSPKVTVESQQHHFTAAQIRHMVHMVTAKGILRLCKTLPSQTAKWWSPNQGIPWSQQALLLSNQLHSPFTIRAELSASRLHSESCCSSIQNGFCAHLQLNTTGL